MEEKKDEGVKSAAEPGRSRAALRRKKKLMKGGGGVVGGRESNKKAPEDDEPSTEFRARLQRFYEAHAPSKLAQMEPLLRKFSRDESSLFDMLTSKYGQEPAFNEDQASTKKTTKKATTATTQKNEADKDGSKADALLNEYDKQMRRRTWKESVAAAEAAAAAEKAAGASDGDDDKFDEEEEEREEDFEDEDEKGGFVDDESGEMADLDVLNAVNVTSFLKQVRAKATKPR